ncbi:hypothetical protein BGW39_000030 [Mortierella sp. 14UC]|nr:hypothetical protein BGW39_000030 [Mortierella sp. 14UC]
MYEQLDAIHRNNGDSNTTQSSKKPSKFRTFFGVSKSEPKANGKPSGQSLPQPVSQQSNLPQVNESQDKPLPVTPSVSQPRTYTFVLENVSRPTVRTELPRLQQRIERTGQLIYCNAVLLQDATSPLPATIGSDEANDGPTNTVQGSKFTKTEQDWLAEIKQDPMEQDHLRWLVARMVIQFIQDAHKDSTEIAEIVALGPVLQREPYRKLLSSFIKDFDESLILDVDLLEGLVQLVQSASPGFLEPDDLVKVLSMFRIRLERTHQQTSENPYRLALAISRILDVMADHKVQDLDRVVEHEPLSGILSGLQGSSDPFLIYQACYAFQALQFVPDNETPLQAVLRHSVGVVDGLVQISSVFKLDLASVLEGLESLQENLGGAFGVAKTVYEGVSSLLESGRSVFDSLKEGYGSGKKRPWYSAIRAAYAFVQAGQLKDLNRIIVEAPCRRDPLFQWGVCHLLGEIASDAIWDVAVRLRSVDLLGDLYRNDPDWGKDESVKAWMLTIINKLGVTSDMAVNTVAQALLRDLKQDQYTPLQHPYPLRVRLPLPTSSPILSKVQNVPYVEYAIQKFRLQRLTESKQTVYIPPMAKANLQARDDDHFLLMDKVNEFLESNRQVMLILGNSGAGKSTFNQHLEHQLWTDYKRGGSIPLFINLPAIDEPQHDMVAKQLTTYNFTKEQIQELKLQRRVVLICDGYDESQQLVNLHRTNSLNQTGQWSTKMVISCRSQYLGQDYRSRFAPTSGSHYARTTLELFQEAVITPFSKEQIEQYIEQYIPLEPRVTWRTRDYMDKLTVIPNLMDLVSNPFVLTLALEALPLVTENRQDLTNIKLSRVQLYDTFASHWLDVNKRRLEGMMTTMTEQDRSVLDQLLDAGFVSMGIEFSTNLAAAIFERQGGNPVVRYVHLSDKNTWRTEFFSPDPEVRLLRESSPLSRTGSLFRFLHRSMQEYFFSRTIFAPPNSLGDRDEFAPQPDSLSSDDHAIDTEGPLFRRSLLTEPSILQFLGDRVKQHPWFKQHLLGLIELSKSDSQSSQAATNAITILVRAGVAFNGADLRGIRIPGADLSGGQFDSAQLQGADLTGVNLTKAWIRQVDFRGACMEGARFGELPYLQESESVECCAVSLDGKSFAAGLFGGGINFYDTATWTRTGTLQGHEERVTSLAFSPNSQQLLSGSVDKTLRLWGCQTGTVDFILEGHSNEVATVVFSPTGKQVASASRDKSVRLWDTHTGAVTFVLTAHTDEVTDVTYSPDGGTIASTSLDGTVRIFDTLTGQSVQELKAGRTYSRLAYSPDGRRVAIGGHLGLIQLWDASTMEQGLGWKAHSSAITGSMDHHLKSRPDCAAMGCAHWFTRLCVYRPPAACHRSDILNRWITHTFRKSGQDGADVGGQPVRDKI